MSLSIFVYVFDLCIVIAYIGFVNFFSIGIISVVISIVSIFNISLFGPRRANGFGQTSQL
ncbi:hypothetical protein L917_07242 [Phytophthora nicotianae]|uniref:Uncharacterized protein n=1 Tax=Phytophthora nicotianae TaxID=4792 RepID=W2LDS3_PHYNI|nr:hypothetical protein L915_07408 [Phytophthora nicotianae]ETL41725.1 hypothetical protein L916_07352 [Phytophthora nicotianae]ETL94879.1 hypothetical protein L917_07242 [Phytophthora nicotianae]